MHPEADAVSDSQCADLGGLISRFMGLHFPAERWDDLRRGLAGAAKDLGHGGGAALASQLLSTPPDRAQIQALAAHLTIGETYFFRDKGLFGALATRVLPDLIAARRAEGRKRLRFWSAGCCTGEEAYSLAILLREMLPDFADWHIAILATDINPDFLRKAVAGSYGDWSFRDAPAGLRERWFQRAGEHRHLLDAGIRKMVTFAQLNLAEDGYPSLATDTNAMDLIFCRNVLMYFTAEIAARVVENLRRALRDDGWLAVSPSEASQELFPRFAPRNFPGVILYQKSHEAATPQPPPPSGVSAAWPGAATEFAWFPPEEKSSPSPTPEPTPAPAPTAAPKTEAETAPGVAPLERAAALYSEGRYEDATDSLRVSAAGRALEAPACALLTRAAANLGRLSEALSWSERWLAADKLDPAAHYLCATVLLEQGERPRARAALQRAIYLDPDFAPAHFALGNLERMAGRPVEAERHFANARRLLSRLHPGDVLAETDGLTAGRLLETIDAISEARLTT